MKKWIALLCTSAMVFSLTACGSSTESGENGATAEEAGNTDAGTSSGSALISDKEYIEETLNLANNTDYTWSYSADSDAWTMSIVSAVAYPEIEDEEGVSVCVPGAYVSGIDTSGDGTVDVTADNYSDAVNGALIIDYDAEITSTNGQIYTAATAPIILNTGAAGYSSSTNTQASSTYAAEGYINVSCGNRGKQDTATDSEGNTYYTGDAPSCLSDQKAAARFVKYNILLGNLPGNVDYLVSTGGSGGGAHATMFAATSNNPDFYPYQEEVGAVGVYLTEDGSYTTTVTIDGEEVDLSDGAWGCIAYSAITSLYEADMALAFEYYLDTDYSFGTDFQAQLAEYLSEAYMNYISEQNLSVAEADVGFDLDGDGALTSTIALTIEYDEELYTDTNGYGGSYLDLYLAEFVSNLQWYLDNLDYAEGWTWFDTDGNALSDDEVAAMTTADKAEAFLEGRYAAASSGGMGGGMPGAMGGGMGQTDGMPGGMGDGVLPDDLDTDSLPDGGLTDTDAGGGGIRGGKGGGGRGELPDDAMDIASTDDTASAGKSLPDSNTDGAAPNLADGDLPGDSSVSSSYMTNLIGDTAGDTMDVGTPDAGTTQSASGSTDSTNYSSYEEMLEAYEADIAEILAGDEYGNNIVSLYNPLNYIGEDDTEDPSWVRILMGASEGDMSMFTSLNLQIAMLNACVDCNIEWQWNGGHVPSEIFSSSFALYVDQMYAEYAAEAEITEITAAAAEAQTANGDATEATGTDLSSWVNYEDTANVSFSLADAASYRTAGASKAMPGFDVIDYGQEDYVFGSDTQDARHWDTFLLAILQEHEDTLSELFNAN
ncbi:MAG: hypothetical protein LIO86_01065 [Lachnospiraceae bacterium]|nr:hypothetical protein [Lachnospiraceae bacterium]